MWDGGFDGTETKAARADLTNVKLAKNQLVRILAPRESSRPSQFRTDRHRSFWNRSIHCDDRQNARARCLLA
jgi:hypothetical protein